jgi:hypothetical protein
MTRQVARSPPERPCAAAVTGDLPHAMMRTVSPQSRRAAKSFPFSEGANPRHEHEWRLFEEVKLPEGKVIIDPKITWAKLAAMAEGARLASKELWGAASM